MRTSSWFRIYWAIWNYNIQCLQRSIIHRWTDNIFYYDSLLLKCLFNLLYVFRVMAARLNTWGSFMEDIWYRIYRSILLFSSIISCEILFSGLVHLALSFLWNLVYFWKDRLILLLTCWTSNSCLEYIDSCTVFIKL